jgi:formimidoylglutamase
MRRLMALRKPATYQVPRFFDPKDRRLFTIIQRSLEAQANAVNILGIPYDGAVIGRKGAVEGPTAIRQVLGAAANYNPELGVDLLDARVMDLGDMVLESEEVERVQAQVKSETLSSLDRSSLLLILGGDNSLSLGSIGACAEKYDRIGLVVLDAHYDLRGKMGGRPTSGSSYGLAIKTLQGHLEPSRTVEIGIRGFVNSRIYADEAKQLGITIYTSADVRKRGAATIAQEAFGIASKEVDAIYFSVDIDCVDIAQVCGVSAPSVGGLEPWEVNEIAYYLARQKEVVCADLVELAPSLDSSGRSQIVATSVVLHLIAGFKMRGSGKT